MLKYHCFSKALTRDLNQFFIVNNFNKSIKLYYFKHIINTAGDKVKYCLNSLLLFIFSNKVSTQTNLAQR